MGLTLSITYNTIPPDLDLRLQEIARQAVRDEWESRIHPAVNSILPPQESTTVDEELAVVIRQSDIHDTDGTESGACRQPLADPPMVNVLATSEAPPAMVQRTILPWPAASQISAALIISHQMSHQVPQMQKKKKITAHLPPAPPRKPAKTDEHRTYVNEYHQATKAGALTSLHLSVRYNKDPENVARNIWLKMKNFDASFIAACQEAPMLRTRITSRLKVPGEDYLPHFYSEEWFPDMPLLKETCSLWGDIWGTTLAKGSIEGKRCQWLIVEDPEWWSPLMKTAFWASFYEDPPAGFQIFRLPDNLRFNRITLPSQLPPPATVHKALVDPKFLNHKGEEFTTWANSVPNPPKEFIKASASKPSLQSMLEKRTDGLCEQVKRHTMVLKDLEPERRLDWLMRRETDPKLFRALVRRDIWGLIKKE
ncbi:hypothetical protein IAR50_004456 [Cryptococcus sp. DSM 104548]